MASYHMEALRKQRLLDRKIAAMDLLEKESETCECAKSSAAKRGSKSSSPKKGSKPSAPKKGSKPSAPKKGSKSSASKRRTESSASTISSESSECTDKSRSSGSTPTRSTKLSSRNITPFSPTKASCSKTPRSRFQSIPPGMSPYWAHHLRRQARILRDHGLVMGNLVHFMD
ncbi:translation initiation factor IF-2-like [Chiloscyllium plagiosum]|uniref:translation initiation factor IF-2-like n=1 Tax=Chiloscyllium plagiosum TaxID=36176 RepID=UPI001CB86840|nr:translation initiation factor IF-2-like [Chiloscyllium plagiosum]XP_043559179.1 translation initiation factor IF-2-like [Chiloscyllium plagiosum]